jgi:thymidylate kinase
MPGRLYVFEGVDGSGKTSLAKAFCGILTRQEHPACYFSFPGREQKSLGKHVYKIHHAPLSVGIGNIQPSSLQTLHIAAHIDAIESKIVPAIEDGKWVVLDRYWWSTIAYGMASGVKRPSLELMVRLEMSFWKRVLPKALFLIERRKEAASKEAKQAFTLSKYYHQLMKAEKRKYPIYTISNDGSIDAALESILKQTSP